MNPFKPGDIIIAINNKYHITHKDSIWTVESIEQFDDRMWIKDGKNVKASYNPLFDGYKFKVEHQHFRLYKRNIKDPRPSWF